MRADQRSVLATLTSDRLRMLSDAFELDSSTSADKNALVDLLARSRRASFAKILGRLQRDELKAACRAVGLDDSGKQKTSLVDRILGRGRAAKQAPAPPKSTGEQLTLAGVKAAVREPFGSEDKPALDADPPLRSPQDAPEPFPASGSGPSMDAVRKLIVRKMFQLRVYEAQATEYQRLFEKVMQYRFEDFVPIKPDGSVGDRKNDGYIPSTGTYFQVHSPENPSSSKTVKRAAKKSMEDFKGLVSHWQAKTPIRSYRFAYNDLYRGSPPQVEDAMAAIRKIYNDVDARVFLAKDLENEALRLPYGQLIDVINTPIPEPGILSSVDFEILREVVNHVMRAKVPITQALLLKAPDFDDKVEFNGLTRNVAALLTCGSYQREAVIDFFSKNANFARQQLRDRLADMYQKSKIRLSKLIAEPGELGDLVFFDLLNKITPAKSASKKAYLQEAAFIVMAFYFEACDIFEDPDAVT